MNTISYLKEVYGYGNPIFLKDVRIGGKSKSAIRKDLSRGVERGQIVRKGQGVYCFKEDDSFVDGVTFENVIEKKFIKDEHGIPGLEIDVYGYVSGLAFLNHIGISQQVPAIIEIATNKTSCKRTYRFKNRMAIIRKGKIEINRFNYKALQFFDIFYLIDEKETKDNHVLLERYIANNLTQLDFEKYASLYPTRIIKIIVETGLINAFR